MFCFQCGTKMTDGASFCPKCGAKQVDAQPLSEEKTEAPYEKETPPAVHKTPEELCKILETELSTHPDFQSVKACGNEVVLSNEMTTWRVRITNRMAEITSGINESYTPPPIRDEADRGLLYIMGGGLVVALISFLLLFFLMNRMDYDHIPPVLAIILFVTGILCALVPCLGRKTREQASSIWAVVHKVVKPYGIIVKETAVNIMTIIFRLLSALLLLSGVCIFIYYIIC